MEMFKILKGVDKIGEVECFSRVDSVMTLRTFSLRTKKMRVRTVLRRSLKQSVSLCRVDECGVRSGMGA